jgi:hypothetical protein
MSGDTHERALAPFSPRSIRATRHGGMLCAMSLACSPVEEPDLIGDHVEFYLGSGEASLCEGSVAHIDRYMERASEFLGVKLDDYRVAVRVDETIDCASYACYYPDMKAVYVKLLDPSGYMVGGILRHEVTHAVVERYWGRSVPFFAEGLAEALGNSLPWGSDPELAPIRGSLAASAAMLDYGIAARFVRFLVDTRGMSRFETLYRTAQSEVEEQIVAHVETIYGESFESIEQEFLNGEPRCQYQFPSLRPSARRACRIGLVGLDGRVVHGSGLLWQRDHRANCDRHTKDD